MAKNKYILSMLGSQPNGDGLRAINLENGKFVWWFDPRGNRGGLSPAVDQENEWIYFQTYNKLWKINAWTGEELDHSVGLTNPNTVTAGNTILVNDSHGYFIASPFYSFQKYGDAVRVFDENLDLSWEDTGLMLSVKSVMAYNNGILYVGIGNCYDYAYIGTFYNGDLENAGVRAYDITDGTLLWEYICDPLQDFVWKENRGIIDCIYCNGYIIFNTRFQDTTEIYVLNASDGSLVQKFVDASGKHTSCAPDAISGGKLFTGSLQNDTIRVYTIGTGSFENFNTFGYIPQTNHNQAHPDSLQSIAGVLTSNEVDGADQGGIIYDSVGYFLENGNVLVMNPDTLAIIDNWTIGNIWDSIPMVVRTKYGKDAIIIKESENARAIAINSADGERLWNTSADLPGNLFFGFNYFDLYANNALSGLSGRRVQTMLHGNDIIKKVKRNSLINKMKGR